MARRRLPHSIAVAATAATTTLVMKAVIRWPFVGMLKVEAS